MDTELDLSIQIRMKFIQAISLSQLLSQHFHEGKCKGCSYEDQILEKLENNGKISRNVLYVS